MADWTTLLMEKEREALTAAQDGAYLAPIESQVILRTVATLRALVAALKEAGVTDYSTLTGSHRVDCHFCNGVWTSGQPPKHHKDCPLTFTEADMLARLEVK